MNSLTAAASLQCDEPIGDRSGDSEPKDVHPQLAKGKALGRFRSAGQLGRAIGPLIGGFIHLLSVTQSTSSPYPSACGSYWTLGPSITYAAGAGLMFLVSVHMRRLVTGRKLKHL